MSAPAGHSNSSPLVFAGEERILLVEDHPVYRLGLRQLLTDQPDFAMAGETDTGTMALSMLREMEVDAAMIDISLAGSDGIELVKQVRAEHPHLPLLVLSVHDERVYALRALRAGANGYMMKREEPGLILASLREVLAGEIAVSARFKEHVLSRVLRGHSPDNPGPVESLTDRELELLTLLGRGLATREIAQKLHLSPKTVESHRLHIKEKLQLQSSGEMIRFAAEWVAREATPF